MTTWSYSTDGGDVFHGEYESRSAAIDAARRSLCFTDGFFWVARNLIKPSFSDYVDLDFIFEHVHESAFGDVVEGMIDEWPCPPEKQRIELLGLIDEWATRHGLHPEFWIVDADSIEQIDMKPTT